jgi:molybdopterin-binding protein
MARPKKNNKNITPASIVKQYNDDAGVQKDTQVKSVIDASVISDIPVELANNLTLIARKLTAFLSYYSAASLNRLNTLNKFISDAEEKLYNVNVDKLDMKELNARYKEAKKAQAEIMTICSQVSKQAVDTDNTARVDEVYNLLKSLSSSTLQELQNALSATEDDDDIDIDDT